jgi:hypothetical protein
MFSRSHQKTYGFAKHQNRRPEEDQVTALRRLGLVGSEPHKSSSSGGSWRSDHDRHKGGPASSFTGESFPEKSTLTWFFSLRVCMTMVHYASTRSSRLPPLSCPVWPRESGLSFSCPRDPSAELTHFLSMQIVLSPPVLFEPRRIDHPRPPVRSGRETASRELQQGPP